jgi:hypothetical protein
MLDPSNRVSQPVSLTLAVGPGTALRPPKQHPTLFQAIDLLGWRTARLSNDIQHLDVCEEGRP